MARISYDEQTAAAFKAVREVPREGLSEWREAVRRQLRPSQGMTLVDIGAGTGAFAAAFSDWFELSVLAVGHPPSRCSRGMRAPYRCQMDRQTPHGSRLSFTTSRTSKSPHTRSAASSVPAPPSSSVKASRAESTTGSSSSVGSLRPLGRPQPSLPWMKRAERSRPQDSTRTLSSRFGRRTRPASRSSSPRWTVSATPTPRCAISLMPSSSAVKNASAEPYDMPRT